MSRNCLNRQDAHLPMVSQTQAIASAMTQTAPQALATSSALRRTSLQTLATAYAPSQNAFASPCDKHGVIAESAENACNGICVTSDIAASACSDVCIIAERVCNDLQQRPHIRRARRPRSSCIVQVSPLRQWEPSTSADIAIMKVQIEQSTNDLHSESRE